MKFCYLDESGLGDEPILVMAGVIVDASRMHLTKNHWAELLALLSTTTSRPVKEFHTREFYRGNGPWRSLDGRARGKVIGAILDWVAKRRHTFTFSAIRKDLLGRARVSGSPVASLPSDWSVAAMHCLLSIQKHHQRQEKNKGNTVLIFDREVKEESRAAEMVIHPPGWTDAYYGRGPKQGGLDQIVDVPYFADSQHALLLQVADLVAYVLRKHGELVEGLGQEAYVGEQRTVGEWAEAIFAQCIPQAMRYPKKARCQVAEAFWAIAPESLRR